MENNPEIKRELDPRFVQYSGYAALALSISATMASMIIGRVAFSFMANGVLIAYLITACILATKGNATIASQLGENVYFLGYLLTITGLSLLAYEIGNDATLLDKANINQVLLKGGNSVFSTLIGLIGMNLIKGYAQSLDQGKEEEADAVERILIKFAEGLEQAQVSQWQDLIKVFESSQLSSNMQSLSSQLGASARDVKINTAALNDGITTVTTGMEAFNDSLEAGNKQVKFFVDASKQHHDDILKMMQTFQERMQTLTPLTGAVDEFVKAANTIVPTLQTIGENFREVGNLNQNLKLLVESTVDFNGALTIGETGMLGIVKKSEDMGLAVDELITLLKNQVHNLTTLSTPFEKFAKLSERINPVMETTDLNIKRLTQFTGTLAGLQDSVQELEGAFKGAKNEMDGISNVIENFVNVTENRLRSKTIN